MARALLFWILCLSSCLYSSSPNLTPRVVREKMQHILDVHFSYQSINQELAKRTLKNFLTEIDPAKLYFLEEEVERWLSPSEKTLSDVADGLRYGKYAAFHEIQKQLPVAISRRNAAESTLEEKAPSADISVDSWKTWEKRGWAKTPSELKNRWMKLRYLHENTASKLDEKTRSLYLKMIQKNRSIREKAMDQKDPKEQEKWILVNVLKAFCQSLDSNTSYFTPREAVQFMIQVQQRLFGIGAQLKDTLDGFSVMRILEGSPAEKSTLKMGDRIIAVDNQPVAGLNVFEAVEKIRGEQGSKVTLTVLREVTKNETASLETIDVELTRDEIVLEDSRIRTETHPFGDGVIAHVRLFSFYRDENTSSSKDIKNALQEVQKNHHLKGVILDLRNNSGGMLDEAVKVTSLFIENGIVVSVKDSLHRIYHSRAQNGKAFWQGPLIVLTNKLSASSSEIVTGSLQDYGRSLTVGDSRTFGKGTFQGFTLDASSTGTVNPEGEFKVTRGMYYTVSGKSPQLVGVKPDLIVPGLFEEADIGESFGTFPIQEDAISPRFVDDLSDIPLLQRKRLGALYRKHLQKAEPLYQAYQSQLQQNSSQRIAENPRYQQFLAAIKDTAPAEDLEKFALQDLQLEECIHIMKDLLVLIHIDS